MFPVYAFSFIFGKFPLCLESVHTKLFGTHSLYPPVHLPDITQSFPILNIEILRMIGEVKPQRLKQTNNAFSVTNN